MLAMLPTPFLRRLLLVATLPCLVAGAAAQPPDPGAAVPAAEEETSPAAEAARLLSAADTLRVSSPEEAVAALLAYDRAAVLATAAADDRTLALARLGKANVLLSRGEAADAVPALEEALPPARRSGDVELETAVLRAAADADAALGRFASALARLRAVAVLAERDLRFSPAGFARLDAAEAGRLAGLPGDARAEADRAVAHFRSAGDAALERQALERRAALEREAGAPERALETLAEARALAWDAGDPARAGRLLLEMGRVRRSLGRLDEAMAELREAQETCREIQDTGCAADAHEELASLHLALDAPAAAAQSALSAHVLRREAGDAAGEGRASHALGVALRRMGRLEPALSALEEARRLLAGESAEELAELDLSRARTLAALGRASDAAAVHEAVLQRLQAVGATAGRFEPRADSEQVLAEHLASLAEGGLWARALETSIAYRSADAGVADPGHASGPGSPSLDVDVLRTVALLEGAPLLAWHALDDSLLGFALGAGGSTTGVRVAGLSRGELARLAATARRAAALPSVEAVQPTGADSTPALDVRRAAEQDLALRRLHDALVVPLSQAMGPDTTRVIAWQAAELDGVPLALLLDEAGRSMGERVVIAELTEAQLPRPDPRAGDLLVVVAPDAPPPVVDAVKQALEPPRPAAPARTPDRYRPGRPRTAPPPEPAPVAATPGPARIVSRAEGGFGEAVPGAAAIAWLDAAPALELELASWAATGAAEGRSLSGTVVVLALDEPPPALIDALLAAGARTIVGLRGELTERDRGRAVALLLARLSTGEPVGAALRGAWDSLRSEGWREPWGAFRIVGSLR